MHLLLMAFLFTSSTSLVGQTTSQLSAKLVVEDIRITNDSLVSPEHLQLLRQEIEKQQFGDNAEDEIASSARYELQKEGYFKAYVTVSDLRVLNETPGQSTVAVTLRIIGGQQYRLEHISFSDNRVFASSILRQAFAINDEDVFDTEKILLGLEELRKLYASAGYINFVPVPDTYPNDQAGTVALMVEIDEGKQFKIGGLIFNGDWPETDEGRLRGIFQPYGGGFNVSELIEQLTAATHAMFPGLASASDMVEVRQNRKNVTTVDVYIMRPATR